MSSRFGAQVRFCCLAKFRAGHLGPEPALNPQPYTTGPDFYTNWVWSNCSSSIRQGLDQSLEVGSEKRRVHKLDLKQSSIKYPPRTAPNSGGLQWGKLGLKQLSIKHPPRTGPNFVDPKWEKTYTQTGFEAIVYIRASAKHVSTKFWRSAVKYSQALRFYSQITQLLS